MTRKSPNLEILSADEPTLSKRAERRRIPRLDLFKDQFQLKSIQKIIPVMNLSPMGMALKALDKEDLIHFSVGAELEGILNIHGHKLSLQAHVHSLRHQVVGCEFRELKAEQKKILENYLSPERLGRDLHIVPAGDVAAMWFHGPSGTDLIFWGENSGEMEDAGTPRFKRFSLFVFGSYVQWDYQSGISTGRAEASDENCETMGVVRLATTFLEADPEADSGKLAIAKKLILSSNIPQDINDFCMACLK